MYENSGDKTKTNISRKLHERARPKCHLLIFSQNMLLIWPESSFKLHSAQNKKPHYKMMFDDRERDGTDP